MRNRATWLNILALFALVLAQVTASGYASVSAMSCRMACCMEGVHAGKAVEVKAVQVPVVRSSCCTPKAALKVVTHGEDSGCNCEMAPGGGSQSPSLTALTPTPKPKDSRGHVLLAPAQMALNPLELAFESKPRIVITDSGPPVSRPNYAFLGRAPPVASA